MFIAPRPRSNVVPIRPDVRLDAEAAENRERLAREDRELRVAALLAIALMFLCSAITMALLVWSERGPR